MSRLSLTTLTELERLLPNVARQYHRFILVVGPVGSGKTPLLKELCRRQEIPYLNVNLALSQRLLDLTSKERPLRVRRLLDDHLSGRRELNNQLWILLSLEWWQRLYLDQSLPQRPTV